MTPTSIRAHQEERQLELSWPDGTAFLLPYRFLRGECHCAACVDENTGIRILDLDSIPDEIHPKELGYSGNYALKIRWSDGHSSGLFTWVRLRDLCNSEQAISTSAE